MATDNMITRGKASALIPTQHSKDIIKGLTKPSAALKMMRQVTMSSKEYKMPVLAALPNAFWLSGDTSLKQTTEVEWGSKNLIAEELAVIVPVPEAVLDDSEYDIWGEIKPLLIEAFGAKIDQAVLFGTQKPSSWLDPAIVPGAAAKGNALALNSIADADLAEHINQTMAFVEDDGYDVTGFASRRKLRSKLRSLRTTTGEPLFTTSVREDNTSEPNIYGEPVTYVDNGAWDDEEAVLIAGDWSKAIIGIRQDITFKMFDQGVISSSAGVVETNLMQQDSVALRAVMRVGYAVATPINRENSSNSNRFPFAVLTPEVEDGGGGGGGGA